MCSVCVLAFSDSSPDASRRGLQLAEEETYNLEVNSSKRSHTAPGEVQRREWVQVPPF
jgi:hypothetical protein